MTKRGPSLSKLPDIPHGIEGYMCVIPADPRKLCYATFPTKPPSRKSVQHMVGGPVEVVHSSSSIKTPGLYVQLLCNLESGTKKLRFNHKAELWAALHTGILFDPPLAGPVVVLCGKKALWRYIWKE